MSVAGTYLAPVADIPVQGTIRVPGSKSLTNRELVVAALADGVSLLRAPLHSDDSQRMIEALEALGVEVDRVAGSAPFGDDLRITPPAAFTGDITVDCGQAGTVMRFLTPLAPLATGDVTITAHASALHRPMGAMIHALRDLGVEVDDEGRESLPFVVKAVGGVEGGVIALDASKSSQFVSGLLLSAARYNTGLQLTHTGAHLPSLPHIDMTIDVLAKRGVSVTKTGQNGWGVQPGSISAAEVDIEPDLSNAAPFLAAAIITGGSVTIPGWPTASTQPGALLAELLPLFGASVELADGALTVSGGETISAVDLDLSAAGELAPTLVGLSVFADGPSVFRGIGHIRTHETDRLAALVTELRRIGCGAEETEDGLRVFPAPLHGATWGTYHDHRMATTGALIGLRVPDVVIEDIGTTAKTMPQFAELWELLLAGGEQLS